MFDWRPQPIGRLWQFGPDTATLLFAGCFYFSCFYFSCFYFSGFYFSGFYFSRFYFSWLYCGWLMLFQVDGCRAMARTLTLLLAGSLKLCTVLAGFSAKL